MRALRVVALVAVLAGTFLSLSAEALVSCDLLIGSYCTQWGQTTRCMGPDGTHEWAMCDGGAWLPL